MQININGKSHDLPDVDPDMPLLWALRDLLGLVGAKYGCGVAQCGACTVWLDDMPVRSCQLPLGAITGCDVTTIEGLAGDALHPVQDAWIAHDVAQCGYCEAGQIMSAAALLKRNPNPSLEAIEGAMAGNICRCGTYSRIVDAIQTASTQLQSLSFYEVGQGTPERQSDDGVSA